VRLIASSRRELASRPANSVTAFASRVAAARVVALVFPLLLTRLYDSTAAFDASIAWRHLRQQSHWSLMLAALPQVCSGRPTTESLIVMGIAAHTFHVSPPRLSGRRLSMSNPTAQKDYSMSVAT